MATPETTEHTSESTDHDTSETRDRRTVPLTQLIHLMAEYQRLGAHRQTFQAEPAGNDPVLRGCVIVAGGLAVLAIICITVGGTLGGVAISLLAVIPAAVAVWRGSQDLRDRSSRIDVFDFGMTVYRSGERAQGFRWDTAEVRQQVIAFQSGTPSQYSLEVTGPDGAHARFDDTVFAEGPEWGRAIQSAVTATQLPDAVAAIDSGETVRFGEIGLHLDALTHGERTFAWNRIQLIDARSGLVRIKFDGQWHSLAAVGTIPNFYIFNELAERLRVTPYE